MADEHLGKTLDEVKLQITAHIREARRLLITVNTLEEMMSESKSSFADFIGNEAEYETGPNTTVPPVGGRGAVITVGLGRSATPSLIKPDQFLGQTPLDAAKRYLAMVGHAAQFDEIADAVQRGGAAIKGADWRDRLEMSLLRSVYEVVKVQEKTYGLVSFYTDEQIAGLRGMRRGGGESKKAKDKKAKALKARARAKAKAKAKAKDTAEKGAAPQAPERKGRATKKSSVQATADDTSATKAESAAGEAVH
jgi:hypothetical protein